jgi:hypothetical protein
MAEILVARETFTAEVRGHPEVVRRNQTIRAGHPLTAGREGLFKPLEPDFEWDGEPARAPAKPKAKSTRRQRSTAKKKS